MMMRQLMSVMSVAAACALLSVTLGCGPKGISSVQVGMGIFDVERVMGCVPDRKIRGEGIDLDKETHVYKSGRIHYFKKRVVQVDERQDQRTISGVKVGMRVSDVARVMGCEPDRKIRGEGVDLDKETHVYKSGRIHYFKKRVVRVDDREGEGTISERAQQIKEDEEHR